MLGTDHAGIATQTKVDKKLKSEGISRLEIGRDKFVDACWDWTHEYGGIIVEQIKRMGCSVDFDNERFTMDEDYAQAVRKVFCDWYHDGLIYRGKRIVNWSPQLPPPPSRTTRPSTRTRRATCGTCATR